jgi:hypothetical protein
VVVALHEFKGHCDIPLNFEFVVQTDFATSSEAFASAYYV